MSSLVYQIVHEEPRALVDPNGPIPPAVASVLKRALAKDKERRFPTVKAFADAFEGAATAPVGGERDDHRLAAQPAGRRRAGGGAFAAASPPRRGARRPRHRRSRRRSLAPAARTAESGRRPRERACTRSSSCSRARRPPRSFRSRRGFGTLPSPSRSPPRRCTNRRSTIPPKSNRRLKPESPKPPPAPASPAGSDPSRTNCSPSYYIDAQGDKHFKPDCFLEKKPGP